MDCRAKYVNCSICVDFLYFTCDSLSSDHGGRFLTLSIRDSKASYPPPPTPPLLPDTECQGLGFELKLQIRA